MASNSSQLGGVRGTLHSYIVRINFFCGLSESFCRKINQPKQNFTRLYRQSRAMVTNNMIILHVWPRAKALTGTTHFALLPKTLDNLNTLRRATDQLSSTIIKSYAIHQCSSAYMDITLSQNALTKLSLRFKQEVHYKKDSTSHISHISHLSGAKCKFFSPFSQIMIMIMVVMNLYSAFFTCICSNALYTYCNLLHQGQTTTPGASCPTLCEQCVGSLTSPVISTEDTGDGTYGLSSFSEKTRMSNHLQM